MKTCSTCKTDKPLDQFHTNTAQPDGKNNQCKACRSAARANGKRGSNGCPYTKAYHMQKLRAKEREIEFLFDRDQWVAWWGEDIDKRGCKPNDLHMCRYDDVGPYHPDNVYKDTCLNNSTAPRTRPE